MSLGDADESPSVEDQALQRLREQSQRLAGEGGRYQIETRSELKDWIDHHLNVQIPDKAVCSDHVSPFEALARAYFARDRLTVWKASRGFGGKSFLLATLALTELITLNADVSLLGGSGEQARRVLAYLSGERMPRRMWNAPHFPQELFEHPPTKQETSIKWGGCIKALQASQKSVRGPHPQRMRLDEVDEMAQDLLDAALGQPMSARGVEAQTVLSSTHQHPDGTMTEVLERAERNGFPVYEWCFKETREPHGWLDPKEIEAKRSVIPQEMWEREFLGQEPEPQNRLLDGEAIERTFDEELGSYDGNPGEAIQLERPDPRGTDYYHGTDWGKSQDWTIIHTLRENEDEKTLTLVAWQRLGRVPWPAMIQAFEERVEAYPGDSFHDGTGVQQMVGDSLNVDSEPWDFARGKDTREMLSTYIKAIESDELRYPMIEWMYHEHKYLTYEQVYGSAHLPDSVAAGALAYHAYQEGSGFSAATIRVQGF